MPLRMRIIWSLQAQNDLAEIRAYICAENPSAAARVAQQILTAANNLRTTPAMGSFDETVQERRLVISGLPYFISYAVDSNEGSIKISRIYHTSRQWPTVTKPDLRIVSGMDWT
jgi:addiction module RelE/StbE family toxin